MKKPKPVNKMTEEEEEQMTEILYKVVKRADRHILTTLNSIFEKVNYDRKYVIIMQEKTHFWSLCRMSRGQK